MSLREKKTKKHVTRLANEVQEVQSAGDSRRANVNRVEQTHSDANTTSVKTSGSPDYLVNVSAN